MSFAATQRHPHTCLLYWGAQHTTQIDNKHAIFFFFENHAQTNFAYNTEQNIQYGSRVDSGKMVLNKTFFYDIFFGFLVKVESSHVFDTFTRSNAGHFYYINFEAIFFFRKAFL